MMLGKRNKTSHSNHSSSSIKHIKRLFITGGAGFIGANLVKYFLDRYMIQITVYDNLSTGSKANLRRAVNESKNKGKVKFLRGDILDFKKLKALSKGHDAIIHLAAHTRVLESLENPSENFQVNSIGTFNALEAARINGIRRFIFASSNAAVGEQIPPINEKMVPKPLSPYGASKLHGEALCSAYYHSYGMETIALRFANAYGPYSEHKTSVVAKFVRKAKKGENLEIYGDGNQTRDFIHAEDICQAIDLSLISCPLFTNPNIWGEIYQIATGVETKIIDLAQIIYQSSKNPEKKIIFTSKRKGEIIKNYSDISKAKKQIRFKPCKKLEKGIAELILAGNTDFKRIQRIKSL
ncbi:MAG: GDP-mannose 4,6-dehydratase [Candidatus Aureabacteria bacterium]|nr:GDP-mannose 4,6-dehydratase [Candidatus Auribacterota bacterium]